jgi:hypothetical protein
MLQIALVIVGGLAVILWAIPGPCVCTSCGFHVNERRMAAARQEELNHDYAHKHGLSCGDDDCTRGKM